MNPEVKEKWATALESGEYKQVRYVLKSPTEPDTFCCLGVLCDLYIQETGDGHWSVGGFHSEDGGYDHAYPPSAVRRWSGLEMQQLSVLAKMNDNTAMSFTDIAKIIREEM